MKVIIPNWPAPRNIHAFTTTRLGGISVAPYDQLNLALHVADNPAHVQHNRQCLVSEMELPREPVWLTQTHSDIVVYLKPELPNTITTPSDASFTNHPNLPCAVLTADCLPLLVCNQQGNEIAAIHAGWRGLLNGIIEATIAQLTTPCDQLLVWLGPAIGPLAFEVNDQIRLEFTNRNPDYESAFSLNHSSWFADIYLLARIALNALGVNHIYGGTHCTVSEATDFFSYRRDGVTGRMASVIYFNKDYL